MYAAGIAAISQPYLYFEFLYNHTVPAHKVKQASVWFVQAK
jgi:hypothetical protein